MISATSNKKDDRSSKDDVTKIKRKGVMIMDKLEKVEKLREKTGVSYEEAKNALEACDYDLLDAIIYLEKLDNSGVPVQHLSLKSGSFHISQYSIPI